MSVEYEANFGIGYEITLAEDSDLGEIQNTLDDKLNDDYESFTTGNFWSGEDLRLFVRVKKPFKPKLYDFDGEYWVRLADTSPQPNLTTLRSDLFLKDRIERLGFQVGEFGLYGGLCIG